VPAGVSIGKEKKIPIAGESCQKKKKVPTATEVVERGRANGMQKAVLRAGKAGKTTYGNRNEKKKNTQCGRGLPLIGPDESGGKVPYAREEKRLCNRTPVGFGQNGHHTIRVRGETQLGPEGKPNILCDPKKEIPRPSKGYLRKS